MTCTLLRNSKLKTQNSKLSTLVAVLFVGLSALAVRVALLAYYPFDGLYGQDAFYYLSATNRLIDTWTDPARLGNWLSAWGTPPLSVWPLGYHVQMALASLFVGRGPASGLVVSLVAGVLTAIWTCLLTLRISQIAGGPPAGTQRTALAGAVLAGLIMSVSALAVRSSVVVMADMAGLQWATLGALLTTHHIVGSARLGRSGLLAGLCMGIASVTRYIYALLLVPALLSTAVAIRRRHSGVPSYRRALVRALATIALPALLLVVLQVVHNLAHPMSSPLPSPVIATWNPVHAWQTSFDGPDGHLQYERPMGLFFFVVPLFSTHALGPALVPLVLLGLVWLWRSRALVPALLIVGWWLLFAGFYSGNIYQADRFILSFLPPLAVLAGLGLILTLDFGSWILDLLPGQVKSKIQTPASGYAKSKITRVLQISAPVVAVGLSLIGLAAGLRASIEDYRTLYDGKQDYLQAVRCTQEAVSRNGSDLPVLTFQITFALRQYTSLEPHELFFETPGSVDTLLAGPPREAVPGGARGYLVVPLQKFEEQWGNTGVGRTYLHLQSAYKLTRVPCAGTSFTIFEIR